MARALSRRQPALTAFLEMPLPFTPGCRLLRAFLTAGAALRVWRLGKLWLVASLWLLAGVPTAAIAQPEAAEPEPAAPDQDGDSGDLDAAETETPPDTDAPGTDTSASPDADAPDDDAPPDAETAEDTQADAPTDPTLDVAPPTLPALPPTEAEKARGLPIAQIEVAGNRRVTETDILSSLKLKVGKPFDPDLLTQDVMELYNSGLFDDIEVDLTRGDRGVVLRFLVRERPTVREVEFEGNDEIDDDDLAEAIEVKEGMVLSHPAVRRSLQKVRDMYAEQGYFLVEADSEIIPLKNNGVSVKIRVAEHNQVTVRRITFIGNDSISDEELRSEMATGNLGFFAFGTGGPFRQDAFEVDIAKISGLYYDRGFLEVSIHTPRIMLTPDRSGIEVTIVISEGPRYRIRQLRVYERGPDGEEVEPIGGRRNLRMMVRAESGQYFNRAALLEDLNEIRSMYRDHGYARVDANPQTKLHPERHEVDVIVPVVRGPKVFFDRIEIRGNTKTRDKVIRRELEVAEGEPFHESNLERSRRRVTALGYFERVDISTEESGRDKMNVYIEVTERPTGTFQVGAGFSSIENFIATAQVQQANLFGNGQRLQLQAQLSGLRQLINVSLVEPYFLDSRFTASINLFDQLRVFNDFSQASQGGELTFGYPLVEPELTASLTYTLEEDEVSTQPQSTFFGTSSGVSVFSQLPLANLFDDGLTSSIGPALTYDTRDNRLFPTSGVYLRGSSELATSVLGSENQFLKNRITGKFFYPLLLPGVVLRVNAEWGLVTSPTQEGVPIFARFFLGGILDVRGFPFRSIGPRLPLTRITDPNSVPIPNGANIGGNLMYYQNVEVEFPIVDAVGVRGVIFTDAGNAWNLEQNYCDAAGANIDFDEINPCFDVLDAVTTLRTSYGFGIRWISPLGPLRFEWGFPFSPLPYESDVEFEFTIGNFF